MTDRAARHGGSQDLEVAEPDQVRNVVLVGPSGAGKTTLIEALLVACGALNRPGSIAEGTTVSDFEKLERAHGRSMSLAVVPLRHKSVKINLIDTPGYADFVGELRAGLRAADCVLFVVAAHEGTDLSTDHAVTELWAECAAVSMPRAVVVSKLDHPRADYEATLAAAHDAFGEQTLPVLTPVVEGSDIPGLVGLLDMAFHDHSGDQEVVVPLMESSAAAHADSAAAQRAALIEGIIEESGDETLMEQYVAGERIDVESLAADLERAVARGTFFPVVPVCSTTGLGCVELLDLIMDAFPAPARHPSPEVFTPAGLAAAPIRCDPEAPLVAEVVKTTSDPYVGRVSLVRVFSGTLRPDARVHVSGHFSSFFGPVTGHDDHDRDERIGPLGHPCGQQQRLAPQVIAGDIGAIGRLASAETGDTLSSVDVPVVLRPWGLPTALLPVAIEASTQSDDDKLSAALSRLAAEDPSLRIEHAADTGQLIVWAMGQAHAELALGRLRQRFGVAVSEVPLRVALRQTFLASAKGHGRHVKQSGGHGQYAVCDIEVDPLPEGSGFEFIDKVVGGAVPRQFIASVEKGVRGQMARGLEVGYPIVDLRVTLVDGKSHSVDSSDVAFQAAGSLALRDAAARAGLAILEPYDLVSVSVAETLMGAVLSDLATRRGRPISTDLDQAGRAEIRALVPAVELSVYPTVLRSVSRGAGSFSRAFDHYELTI